MRNAEAFAAPDPKEACTGYFLCKSPHCQFGNGLSCLVLFGSERDGVADLLQAADMVALDARRIQFVKVIPRDAQRDCCEEMRVLKAQQKRVPA